MTTENKSHNSDSISIHMDKGFLGYRGGDPVYWTIGDDKVADVRVRRRVTLDVVESCGFCFDNVVIQSSSITDVSTGEIRHQSMIVLPDGENLDRIFMEIANLDSLNKSITDLYSEWNSGHVERMLEYAARHKDSIISEKSSSARYVSATITVEPLTPTGKIKKYPVHACLLVTAYAPDKYFNKKEDDYSDVPSNITSKSTVDWVLYFTRDGRVGKGRINVWLDRDNTMATFDSEKNGLLYSKKITKSDLESGKNITVYPC